MLIIAGAANQHLSQNGIFRCSFCSANQHSDSTWKNVDSDWAFESTSFCNLQILLSCRQLSINILIQKHKNVDRFVGFESSFLCNLQIMLFLKARWINILFEIQKMLIIAGAANQHLYLFILRREFRDFLRYRRMCNCCRFLYPDLR